MDKMQSRAQEESGPKMRRVWVFDREIATLDGSTETLRFRFYNSTCFARFTVGHSLRGYVWAQA